MRIGVITFWESDDNYGQALQCWALQQQLIKMGHEPFLIKYVPLLKTEQISIIKILWKLIRIYPVYQKLKRMQAAKRAKTFILKNKQRDFDAFREKYIRTSSIVYNGLSDIQNNPPEADCYICGSDQIWSRLLDNDENQAFYLNFGKKETQRIAYAASFGRDIYPTKLNAKLHDMLVKLDAVSVRERSGIDICAKVGIQAIDVLDPTLLLSLKEYSQIIERPSTDKKYFYTYSLNVTSEKELCWSELLKYADLHELTSISTASSGYLTGREICSNTQYVYATIPQWLGLILNAEFVATTSFHGVVFCLVLHKNFIYFPLKGVHSRGNSRVVSLLTSLNLQDKVYDSHKSVRQCIEYSINWNDIDGRLGALSIKSKDFLETNLK